VTEASRNGRAWENALIAGAMHGLDRSRCGYPRLQAYRPPTEIPPGAAIGILAEHRVRSHHRAGDALWMRISGQIYNTLEGL